MKINVRISCYFSNFNKTPTVRMLLLEQWLSHFCFKFEHIKDKRRTKHNHPIKLPFWKSLQCSNRELGVLIVHLEGLEVFANLLDQLRHFQDLERVNRSDVRIDRRHWRLPASSDCKNPSRILKFKFNRKISYN